MYAGGTLTLSSDLFSPKIFSLSDNIEDVEVLITLNVVW
jgi:hypothetical protein